MENTHDRIYKVFRMNCIICSTPMSFYFSKYFGQYGLETVDYWLCPACGFVASKTHFDLSQNDWESLNLEFHLAHNAREDNRPENIQPLIQNLNGLMGWEYLH